MGRLGLEVRAAWVAGVGEAVMVVSRGHSLTQWMTHLSQSLTTSRRVGPMIRACSTPSIGSPSIVGRGVSAAIVNLSENGVSSRLYYADWCNPFRVSAEGTGALCGVLC